VSSRWTITALHVMLLVTVCAHAVVKSNVRITVLDSETHSVSLGDNGVPKNCDAVNFDAYCHNSKTVEVTNTLLVQEENETPYRISCNVDTKWSRCVPLLKGRSFDANREKRGLLVYYVDESGKMRKQLYTMVAAEAGYSEKEKSAVASRASSPTVGSAAINQGAQTAMQATGAELVKCSFTSLPSGAEVSVDGRYVGSTPSVVSMSIGNHSVEVSMTGFAQWKRQLTVSAGSELSVNAVLQKNQ